jgi:hypothetical protein
MCTRIPEVYHKIAQDQFLHSSHLTFAVERASLNNITIVYIVTYFSDHRWTPDW